MRVIIAGTRGNKDPYTLIRALDNCGFDDEITCVICGMEPSGGDQLGKNWADELGIPVIQMPAEWRFPSGAFDRTAGFKRNEEMASIADALIAVWDGHSPGTADMITRAKRHKLRIHTELYG